MRSYRAGWEVVGPDLVTVDTPQARTGISPEGIVNGNCDKSRGFSGASWIIAASSTVYASAGISGLRSMWYAVSCRQMLMHGDGSGSPQGHTYVAEVTHGMDICGNLGQAVRKWTALLERAGIPSTVIWREPAARFENRLRWPGGSDPVMADSLELILQVCPAPGDNAAELARWLRGELPDLDMQEVDRLPGEAVPPGSADSGGLLLVQLDPKALQMVLAKVSNWAARNERMVEISAGGHTLKLGRPIRRQQEKVIDDSLVGGTEVSRVPPDGETEAVIEATSPVVPNRDSTALEPGKALVPLTSRESLPSIWRLPRERRDLSRRNRLADARLLVQGRINIETLPGQEFRRTAAFAGVSSLLAGGFAVLLSITILAIAKHYHGFSISTNYPVRRVYKGIVRYFFRVTPPPGSPHMLLVYTVYLAVLPVLFAVVFMHLKVGSSKIIVAVIACVIFMAAPFIIVITSIRTGSTNCGSWNYPELNTGSECYSLLTSAFRIAFATGIAGLVVPVIYLIRGRRNGHKNGLLLGTLITCASVAMVVFSFIGGRARRQPRGDRDVTADQRSVAAVNKHLLPHERQVITVRRHPAVLIGPSVLTLAGPVAAGALTATVLNGNEPLVTVVWIVWLVLFFRMIWKAANWAGTFFVVTSQRFLLVFGVLTKKVEMLPLAKVTDMSFQRSFTGRLLGFGEFIIESVGRDQALRVVDHIPYPEQLYLEICGLIFRDSEQASSDEPDSGDD